MNTIFVWDNGKSVDRYTVLKNGRVYVMSENPEAKNGVDEYICSDREVDVSWMDRNQKRLEFANLPEEVQFAIGRRY